MIKTYRKSDAGKKERSENELKGRAGIQEGMANKLSPTAPFGKLAEKFDQVKPLVGMDQCHDNHSLTADMHTEEVLINFMQEPIFSSLSDEAKGWAVLATRLHDIGKGHEDGRQEKEDGNVGYAGHEKAGAILAEEMLPEFEIGEDACKFVLMLIEHHGEMLRLMDLFRENEEPKGGQLGAYERYVSKIREMPGSDTEEGLMRNLRIMIAFSRADVRGLVSSETESERPDLAEMIKENVEVLSRMESALPALVEAVREKEKGAQQAGIVKAGEGYHYKNFGKKKAAYDMKTLGKRFRELGIHPSALGLIQKTDEKDLPEALEKAGLGEHVSTIQDLLKDHRLQKP